MQSCSDSDDYKEGCRHLWKSGHLIYGSLGGHEVRGLINYYYPVSFVVAISTLTVCITQNINLEWLPG